MASQKCENKCQICLKTKDLMKKARVIRKGKIYQYYICRRCNTGRLKKYRNTAIGRENINKNGRKSYLKNKLKASARAKLNYVVKKGILKKGRCEVCGRINTEAHHDDYSKPLDVKWFCRSHHKDFEKQLSTESIEKINLSLYN